MHPDNTIQLAIDKQMAAWKELMAFVPESQRPAANKALAAFIEADTEAKKLCARVRVLDDAA